MKKSKYMGIILILLSAFSFALMNTFVRLAGDLPSVQKSFFRNLIAFIVAFIILKKKNTPIKCNKNNLGLLLVRATCGTIGILCNFYAVDHLLLSDANMLNKMSPFFVIIFSYIFLKEKVNVVQAFSVIIAFTGSMFIVKPTITNMDLIPSVIGLIGGLMAGAAYTAVRSLGNRGEKGAFIVFFFSLFSCVVTLPYLIINYNMMSFKQVEFLLLAGLAATGGQFAITAAYACAPAREISVFDYSQVIFSAIIGYVLFNQIPDAFSIVGYVVICLVAIVMFCVNKRQNKNNKDDKNI